MRKTCKSSIWFLVLVPLSAPRNLRVSDEWYNRLRLSWDAPPSTTMGYRIVYKPINSEFLIWFYFSFYNVCFSPSNVLVSSFAEFGNSCCYIPESAVDWGVRHFEYERFVVTEWCRLEGISGDYLVKLPDQNMANLEQVSLDLVQLSL